MFTMAVVRGTTGTEAVEDVVIGYTLIANVAGKATFELNVTLESILAKHFLYLSNMMPQRSRGRCYWSGWGRRKWDR